MNQKSNKNLVHILVTMLCIAVAACFVPQAGEQAYAADADSAAMAFGSNVLKTEVNKDNMQKLWFAGDDWYVIGYDGEGNSVAAKNGAITLLHQGIGEHTIYNEKNKWSGYPYCAYSESILQKHIESWLYGGERAKLSEKEQEAILPRTLEGGGGCYGDDGYDTNKIHGDTVDNALLWPLSVAEAEEVPEAARAVLDGSGSPIPWWLRTPGDWGEETALVRDAWTTKAFVDQHGTSVNNKIGVRPAFDLDPSKVLFTSCKDGGKSSGSTGADALKEVGTVSGNEWKVTLHDSSRDTFSVSDCKLSGDQLTFSYAGAKTGNKEYISAIITDKPIDDPEANIKYYGRIAGADSASGTLTVNLGNKLDGYGVLYAFNEQYNGDATSVDNAKTDLAGKPVMVAKSGSVTVKESQNGTVKIQGSSDPAHGKALEGSSVRLSVQPEQGYELKLLYYTRHEGSIKKYPISERDGSFYIFTMPEGDVQVYAEFSPVKVSSLRFKSITDSINEGSTYQVTVSINPANAFNRTVEYSSSDESVLSISNNGLITGIKEGKAVVTVKTTDGSDLSRTRTVTVKHNHALSKTDAKTATCTAGGNIEYWTCSVCGKLFRDAEGKTEVSAADTTISALGHEAGEAVKENEVQATCTKAGGYDLVVSCTRCKEVISKNHVTIAAQGHKWSEWEEIPPTEFENGERTRNCSVCGDKETEVIPAIGHNHAMQYFAGVPATCSETGKIAYWKCTKCGNFYEDEAATKKLTSDQLVIPATEEHTAGKVERTDETAATCTQPGGYTEITYCSVCKKEIGRETKTTEALGHDWDDGKVTAEATCTEAGIGTYTCRNDSSHTKTEVIPASGHEWGSWQEKNSSVHQRTCGKCGETEENGHVWGISTADRDKNTLVYTCSECGATRNVANIEELIDSAYAWIDSNYDSYKRTSRLRVVDSIMNAEEAVESEDKEQIYKAANEIVRAMLEAVRKDLTSTSLADTAKAYTGKKVVMSGAVVKNETTGETVTLPADAITYEFYDSDKVMLKNAPAAPGTYYAVAVYDDSVADEYDQMGSESDYAKLTITGSNTLTAKGKTVKLKAKKSGKTKKLAKTKSISAAKAYKIKNPQGSLRFAKVNKTGGKKIKVDAATGKITAKKGLKKGKYKVRVKVTASGNEHYKPGSKTVTVTIRVK